MHLTNAIDREMESECECRVLMVIPSFYPLVGGAERQLMGLLRPLQTRGVNTTIVTRAVEGEKSVARYNGAKIVRLSGKQYPVGFLVELAIFILRTRKQWGVMHVHTLNSPLILCGLLGRLLGIPVVGKVTRSGKGTQLQSYHKNRVRRFLFTMLKHMVSRFVSLTPEVREELVGRGVDGYKIVDIPNGVNSANQVGDPFSGAHVNVVFVGRLIPRKRVGFLLDALSQVADQKRYKLVVLGEGSERIHLEKKVANLGLVDQVTFEGMLEHEAVQSKVASSDVFILPSDSEGMSNALLEAMALGKVVLVADIAANRALISHGVEGCLFSSEEELARILDDISAHPEKYKAMGVKAEEKINALFSFEKVSQDYWTLYQEVTK